MQLKWISLLHIWRRRTKSVFFFYSVQQMQKTLCSPEGSVATDGTPERKVVIEDLIERDATREWGWGGGDHAEIVD